MSKRVVELTEEQVEFLRTSLDYSAKNFREADYSPDHEFGRKRRQKAEEMIDSLRHALADDDA